MKILYLIKNYVTLINPHVKRVHLSSEEKLTVISLDETYDSHRICYDKKYEKVYGPHKCVQTVVARSKTFLTTV